MSKKKKRRRNWKRRIQAIEELCEVLAEGLDRFKSVSDEHFVEGDEGYVASTFEWARDCINEGVWRLAALVDFIRRHKDELEDGR